MNCKKIQELIIADYIDGELGDILKSRIKAHINICPHCTEFERAVLNTVVHPFKKEVAIEPPAYLFSRIKEVIVREKAKKRLFLPDLSIFTVRRPAFAFATAMAIIVAVVFVWMPLRYHLINTYIEEQSQFLSNLGGEELGSPDEEHRGLGTNIEEHFLNGTFL